MCSAKKNCSNSLMHTKFLLLGDSHINALARAAASLGFPCVGGYLGAGRLLNDYFFAVEGGAFKPLVPAMAARLAGFLETGGLGTDLLRVNVPVLTTIGFNTHNFEAAFRREKLAMGEMEGDDFISLACFEAAVEGARRGALEFYRTLIAAGKTIYAIPSPQRFSKGSIAVCRAFENVLLRRLSELGVQIVDVREATTRNDGRLLEKFESDREGDFVHANQAFGEIVLRRFLEISGIENASDAVK